MNLVAILGLLALLLVVAGSTYSATKEKYKVEKNPAVLRGYNVGIFLLLLAMEFTALWITQKEINRRKESEETKIIQVEIITTDGDTILLK
jgi:glucose uptake protein GlcU